MDNNKQKQTEAWLEETRKELGLDCLGLDVSEHGPRYTAHKGGECKVLVESFDEIRRLAGKYTALEAAKNKLASAQLDYEATKLQIEEAKKEIESLRKNEQRGESYEIKTNRNYRNDFNRNGDYSAVRIPL